MKERNLEKKRDSKAREAREEEGESKVDVLDRSETRYTVFSYYGPCSLPASFGGCMYTRGHAHVLDSRLDVISMAHACRCNRST